MNERFKNTLGKYSENHIEYINKLVSNIIQDYGGQISDKELWVETEYIVYKKKDGSKSKIFHRRQEIELKDKEEISLEKLIRNTIDKDLKNK